MTLKISTTVSPEPHDPGPPDYLEMAHERMRRAKWFSHANYGGALVTASGLVFSGNLGGTENAFDTKTGNILWSYDTGAYIQAPTEAYEANGQEYIVVASGQAGNDKIPELPATGQPAIISTFTLK